jgi:phenylacetate-coenzyme A ligase PaaK-like adenylate-forming protein
MTRRIHGTPHDGVWSLQQLIRWSSLTGSSVSPDSDLLEALNALVSFATKHSPFYCEKFKDARIASLEDFRRLPLTTGDEMKRNTPPRNNRALTGNHGNGYVFTSGGTTGEPKFVLRTAAEQDRNATFLAKGLLAGGLKEGDTVANLLFSGNMWGSFVSFSRAVEKAGCRILPIGGNIPPEDILNYLNIFRVDAALAIPSVLLTLAQNAESRGLRLRIPLIFSGGEHIFSENLEYLKRVFEAGRLSSIGYATNDVGALGWQCTHLTGGLHHIHRDLHYVEILDPESLEPSPPGVPGKVVTTNLDRRLQPIIRYEVGDMGRWLDGPCPCGEPGPLFELLGRSDDILIIGGGNIYPEVIREAMAKVEGLSGFFSLRAQLRDRKDELIVRAEAKEDGADCALLAAALEKAVYASSKELNTMLGRGLINPVVVEVVPPGALPRNPRTGKIRLVEDGRI